MEETMGCTPDISIKKMVSFIGKTDQTRGREGLCLGLRARRRDFSFRQV